ncbi:heparan-alpha-glucosaminide N-acetyltransferase [Amorphus orientalis]|uniref:Membrane protein n=1 Tax=Amorphus orientalis TaxID=649198 RepID=A0AAE3VLC2_9HYPH|nr:heparan-alpha-glucosaminide N-acetyltransferase [Amorphus orientalis]MDQ0314107.1 putative membrane protein [Amorphus orientalis]
MEPETEDEKETGTEAEGKTEADTTAESEADTNAEAEAETEAAPMAEAGPEDDDAEAVPTPSPLSSGRIDLLDMVRGIAILAMVVYHFSWDLSFYQLVSWPVETNAGWQWFARLIAGSFLTVVGVSLVVAHQNGYRWKGFLIRLGIIVAAAAAISGATYFAFPNAWIYFGILHCIAAASLLAVLTVRLPIAVPAVLAVVFFALPQFVRADIFNEPFLVWVGLGTLPPPRANDYVPIFPWVGCTFAGVALARLALRFRAREAWAAWRARTKVTRAVAWSGRQSLWIYLAHQPILLGLLWGVAFALGTGGATPAATDAQRASFMRACVDQCTPRVGDAGSCEAICGCSADNVEQAGLWERMITQNLTSDDQAQVDAIVRSCGMEARREAPQP